MDFRSNLAVRPTVLSLLSLAFLLGAAISPATAQVTQHYTETPLTSSQTSLAPNYDANLVNPWGLSRSSKGPWWVSDNGTGLSTLYDGTGKKLPLVVTIPSSETSMPTGSPTGTAYNGDSTVFHLAPGKSAIFLFSTEDGTISGWNPNVSPSAIIVVNHKEKSVYKGLTVANAEVDGVVKTYLYAADFRKGRVAVFDSTFTPVHMRYARSHDDDDKNEGRPFEDERIPEGYAPFNVQNIGGNIVVAFAKQDDARHDEVPGTGNGYVDIFSPTGKLLLRLQHGEWFNAPWGLALASSDFGANSHDILVGQFGSGTIAVFDPITGKFKCMLNDANDQPIIIDGLWAIAFGNGLLAGPANSLYFTAGIDHEKNGLFGTITANENVQGNDQ